MIKKRSKAYWVKRNSALEKSMQQDAEAVKERIINAYREAIEDINADIHATFKAYVTNGVPEGEAKKLLNKAEHDKLYTELLRLHDETDDPKIKNEILGRINAQAYGARISRLEGVKERAYIKLREAGNYAGKESTLLYTDTLQTSYYTHIYNIAKGLNCGINFAILPERAINKMLHEPWKGSNYSARLWKHNDNFISAVRKTIETGIIAGHGTRRMAESLKSFVNGGSEDKISYITERLCRSETAHFMNIAHLEAYKEADIEKYQFVAALSERTCDVCGNLDGETFLVADAMEGENFPPMHANCRCVTVMAGVIPDTRIARDPETGETYKVRGDMTFNEWIKSLTPEQKEALKYVDKSAGSGIIKETTDKSITSSKLEKHNLTTPKETNDYLKVGSNGFTREAYENLYRDERIISSNQYETALVFNSEGKRMFEKKGNANSVKFTNKEIKAMQGCVLTHNHPNGTVFSPEDINIMRRGELSEIRACNIRGVYTLRRTGKWHDDIGSWSSIKDEYWKAMDEASAKYADMAAREGRSAILYLREMDESGMKLFAERYGLEFHWEQKRGV